MTRGKPGKPLRRMGGPFPLFSLAMLLGCGAPLAADPGYTNDFEGDAVGPEWSSSTGEPLLIATTPNGQHFLGRHPRYGLHNETVSLTFDNLPEHQEITVAFDLYIIHSWDGNHEVFGPDQWGFSADGSVLLHTTFNNGHSLTREAGQAYPEAYPGGTHPPVSGAGERNTLGYPGIDPAAAVQDSVYRFNFTFPHSTRSLQLHFFAVGLQEMKDESWGLDHVRVAAKDRAGQEVTADFGTPPAPAEGRTGWNVAADYSETNNPAGAWSYGWQPAPGGTFTLLVGAYHSPASGGRIWNRGGNLLPGLGRWRNGATRSLYNARVGWVFLDPGPNQELAVIRWTSPLTGQVSIQGLFGQGDRGVLDASIHKNGVPVWDVQDFDTDQPFALDLAVTVGDTVDWLVTGGNWAGTTPIYIIIELLPGSPAAAAGSN